jgi:hypothetical protein
VLSWRPVGTTAPLCGESWHPAVAPGGGGGRAGWSLQLAWFGTTRRWRGGWRHRARRTPSDPLRGPPPPSVTGEGRAAGGRRLRRGCRGFVGAAGFCGCGGSAAARPGGSGREVGELWVRPGWSEGMVGGLGGGPGERCWAAGGERWHRGGHSGRPARLSTRNLGHATGMGGIVRERWHASGRPVRSGA